MANGEMSEMNRTVGQLTEAVNGLRRDMSNVLQYIREQNAITDEHEVRLKRLEDCEQRTSDRWKILVGAVVAIIVGIMGAWLKVTLGL